MGGWMGIMKRLRNIGINGTTSPSYRPYVPLVPARAVLLVEAMDGFVPEIKPDAVAVNLGSYMSGRSPCI
jgi:hypothetical protein